ncbi:MAG: PAS domain S-box protein [Cyclobacteriaceae bacterium]|nr:PAS domain S-box protein [Cyclobacteriaceae bacterium]MCB0499801.1 PAS domain S-box protein [Cyclobacteriaceae bacterium]MCB9238609.1 PAS domain S-box protein [Flammeovirgaceae bacterium]MCO5271781.1 PAS domain S-box protein [Cyclobacteriaceae bacterium]MCW5902342.1 PAS domain S-box protein [Cyclobacteriaceae bacterium]
MKRFIRKVTSYGLGSLGSKSEKRNVILANYTSLVTSSALFLLIPAYYLYYGPNLSVFSRLAAGAVLFLLPLWINRFGAVTFGRVLLSWLTPFFVFGISILDLESGEAMSPSSFVGLRLFLLAGFCFPFLIFNLKNRAWLALALSASVLSIIFFDQVFILFRSEHFLNNIQADPFYTFNNIRATLTMLAIGITLVLLKSVVERNEDLNQELLAELERKNRLIKQQAEAEVYKLNEKLTDNLKLLKASESRYRSLFEQASDFIAITDLEGRFVDVNESWCAAFGYTREELLALKTDDLIDPGQLTTEPVRYEELRKGMHVLSYRRMVRKDKTIIEVEANVKKLQADKILVIARDVTQLREAQHQIELNEAKFRGAFENSAIGMAMVSLDLKWLKVNKELCHILGYEEDGIIGKSVSDFTHPMDKEEVFEVKKLLYGEAETYQREKRYVHQNGGTVWVNLNVSLVKGQDGMPLFFVSQIENITLGKKTKELLSIYEANMTATVNNTDIMIWSVDREYKLLMFNNPFFNYAQKRFGIQLKMGNSAFASLEGDNYREITQKWIPLYDRALEGHRITFEETRYGVDLQYSLSPILKTDQVIGVSVFARNVTESKARERELVEANKKIGELKLMALRSVMSPHFIFNVLNSIQFFITKNDRVNALHYLSTFSKLIRNILTHSVKNRIKLTDELDMLENYVHLEMTRFEHKFDFSLTVEPHIEAQAILIPSLLIQPYVENAILHGLYNKKEKGTLSISVNENDGILTFVITDDGIGREAARQLRKYNAQPHQSMGISITEERLSLINKDQKTTFDIEDLKNANGPCGTKVTIGISYTSN